jgi:lysophospholipase L1-like esterase
MGQVNGGQQFNGSDTGIDIPVGTAFTWSNTDSFAIEFWLKGFPGQTCAAAEEVIVGRVDDGGNSLWSLGCAQTSGYAYFRLNDTTGGLTLQSIKAITDGLWHHVVGLRQTGVNRLYVDGREVVSATVAYTGDFGSTAPLNIGWLNVGNGFHFDGLIDEVALYSELLSATDIRTHYYLARGYDQSCTAPVRIMPLGDSITHGCCSGVSGQENVIAYRKDLWESLGGTGYTVDFVGSRISGNVYENFDPDHEGWSGRRDDELAFNIYDNGGDNWLNKSPPEIVLLHIGTNDVSVADPNDVADILAEINQYEAENETSVTVIVARMIHRRDYEDAAATEQFNDITEAAALERLANGDKIIIVDMENGAGLDYSQHPPGDMFDLLHPFAPGYAKIAAVWFEALTDFLPVCILAPTITSIPPTEVTVFQPYSYDVQANGKPAPTYTLTSAPLNMTISPTNGLIEWTPSITGKFSVVVEALNSVGVASQPFTIEVISDTSIYLPLIVK